MYNEFYRFRESPFNITPDPRFLFFSERHREAFNHILFGIRERKGFIQITGEVGAGKTTVCRAILQELGSAYRTALILNPVLDPDQLVKAIAMTILGFIPGVGCILLPLHLVVWLAYMIVTILCIVKATSGQRFLIPGLSDFADKF